MHRYLHRVLLALIAIVAISSNAYADPPGRVGRISYVQGTVSFSHAGKHSIWTPAQLNRPLIAGDRLWADAHGRAELQIGNAALRMEDATSLRILNLNDRVAQFDLSQGTITFDVRRLSSGQIYEINTPQLAFKVTQAGNFRIDVSDAGDATIVTLRSGKGIVYTKNGAYKIKAPGSYRYYNKRFQTVRYYADDSFDRWSSERERRVTRSRSASYVSTSLIGYEDLDAYGNWRYVQGYGNVWMPTHTSSSWAPYRNGHWSYVNPWGWTWIDDQPWGYATSHYGRWARYNNTWVWVPGRKAAQATYAPALVVFIGGSGVSLSWIPLGPRDVYVPPYRVSQQYFTNVNVANTTINQTNITHVYNNPVAAPAYTYHQAPYAVTTVPPSTFSQSQPVAPAAVPVPAVTTTTNQAPPSTTAVVVPPPPADSAPPSTTAAKPPADTMDRVPVVVTPPAPPSTTADTTGKLAEVKPVTPVEQITPPSDKAIPDAATKPEANVEPVSPAAPPSDKKESEPVPVAPVVTPPPVADKEKEVTEQKAAAERADVDKAAAAQAEADKAASEQAQAEKNAAIEKEQADKAERDKAEREKAEREKAQANQEAVKAEASAQEAQRRAEKEAEAEKVNAEREAQAKAEREADLERTKAASEAQANAEREAAAAQAEAQRDSQAQAEAARAAANQAEAERAAAAQDAERAAAAARVEAEQAAAAAAQAAAPPSTTAP
jgi:DNA segregation ATPase FtsK/SpoIIIE-like protein